MLISHSHSDLDLDFKVMGRHAYPRCLAREHLHTITNQSEQCKELAYIHATGLDLDLKFIPRSLNVKHLLRF